MSVWNRPANESSYKVSLSYGDDLTIALPDGREVSILLSYEEPGEQLPELDVMLPIECAINCVTSSPASAKKKTPYAKHIIIPIEPDFTKRD